MTTLRLSQDKLRKIRVLYEDDHVVAIDKPAGLAVHGGAGTKGRDLLAVLDDAYASSVSLHLAHRLDRGTSGVLLIAKRADLAATLQGLWPSAHKRYLAVAHGRIAGPQTIDTPLSTRDGRPQSARSSVTPLQTAADITLVQVDIMTGRHHQIRRHLAGIGHPVLMDDKYGDFSVNKHWAQAVRDAGHPRPRHILLHAAQLTVPHPETGESLTLRTPIPPAWSAWLD